MTPYVADPVYLNGQFLPLAEAGVSPLDRGFLYGDGVYELIPVYSRQAFRLDEHLTRLQATLDGIKLANPLDHEDWKAVVQKLIAAAPWDDQSIYLQVTRGADNKRDHAFPPASVAPTVFAFAGPLVTSAAEIRATGVAAITVADQRWARCDLKVISLLANILARQQAVEEGCAEALLIRDGYLKEGAASNIFVVKNGVLLAPPKTQLMLPGITYDLVLELAECHGQPLEVREISEMNFAAPTRSG
jgi:D-alanine transaminase